MGLAVGLIRRDYFGILSLWVGCTATTFSGLVEALNLVLIFGIEVDERKCCASVP